MGKDKGKDFFDRLFDLDGDGKSSLFEELFVIKMFEKFALKSIDKVVDSSHFDIDDDDKYEWRNYCDDGIEYAVRLLRGVSQRASAVYGNAPGVCRKAAGHSENNSR